MRFQAANLELAAIGRCALAVSIPDHSDDPAPQPFDGSKVEDESVVANLDEIGQIITELPYVRSLHQALIDDSYDRDTLSIRDLEPRPHALGPGTASLSSLRLRDAPADGQIPDQSIPAACGRFLGWQVEIARDPVFDAPVHIVRRSLEGKRDFLDKADQGGLHLIDGHGFELPFRIAVK
jgi:hypothetical protein